MGRPDRWRRWPRPVVGLGLLLAVASSGCTVATHVVVAVAPTGSGRVSVAVVLDRAALAAVGGLGQLDDADLRAAGWSVATASAPGPDTTVTATHAFDGQGQLGQLLAQVTGTDDGRPAYELRVGRGSSGLWSTTTTAVGRIDLRCGLGCAGDVGLLHHFGSVVGVPTPGLTGPGAAAALRADLPVTFELRLPGRPGPAGTARVGRDGPTTTFAWSTPLGADTPLVAATVETDRSRLLDAEAVAAALALVAVVLAAGAARAVRRRRRRAIHAAA